MKKLFCVSFALIIMLCGCEKSPDVTLVTEGLEFTAELNVLEEYEYRVQVITPSHMIFETVKPEKIKDTVTEINGESVILSYKGLENKTDISVLAENSPVNLIYKALVESAQKKVSSYENEFFIEFDGKGSKLYLSQMGLPLKIVFPKKQITVVTKNPTVKKLSGT